MMELSISLQEFYLQRMYKVLFLEHRGINQPADCFLFTVPVLCYPVSKPKLFSVGFSQAHIPVLV